MKEFSPRNTSVFGGDAGAATGTVVGPSDRTPNTIAFGVGLTALAPTYGDRIGRSYGV